MMTTNILINSLVIEVARIVERLLAFLASIPVPVAN